MNNKTPFCKVCFDSGKPDTKHWVKDRSGKVCCPTLLALKCRLCGECGHTVKYCSKTQPNPPKPSVNVQAQAKKPMVVTQTLVTVKPEPKNMFDLLDDDSDEEEQMQEQMQEQQQVVLKKPEQQKTSPAVIKRWIDYDSDSDDEQPLPMPTLKRYGHSDKSDDSFVEASM
jgi:hypothetical protein